MAAAARPAKSATLPTPPAVVPRSRRKTAQSLWNEVDDYLITTLVPQDAALTRALAESRAAGLPDIHVAPNQGKFLYLLARIRGAQRILEIGTLGGYSAIWLARALPANGRLVTLELDPKHAAVASVNLRRAGLAERTQVLLGPASDSLRRLVTEQAEPFDLVFIDADKANLPAYFTRVLALTRAGSVVVVDNVVRRGQVTDPDTSDAAVIGVRQLNQLIAAEPRVTATSIQTVGVKGHDGFTLIFVES